VSCLTSTLSGALGAEVLFIGELLSSTGRSPRD